jgi:anaerobic selenocysteine-containing dehydrogenase
MCGIRIAHREGEILSIKPDRDDVFSNGHICPKAVALKDLHEDPDRLRQPIRRTASGWEAVSWGAAFSEIAQRIGSIRADHGHDAVAIYLGNPTVHNLGATLGVGNFIRAVKTKNLYSATSVDQLPHMVAGLMMFGHQFLMPVPDVDRTQLFVCIGGNPVVSGGSIMGAPGFAKRVSALQARGGRFIVIDPRRTRSAAIADEHLPIRPGTDVFLLIGLLKEVFAAGSHDTGHLGPLIDGVESLREALVDFDLERMSERTGIPSARIRRLARELIDEPRALVYGRIGACTQSFGGLSLWLINCLNALTASLDREGGMMFADPAFPLGSKGHFDRFRSRVRDLPEFSNELPVATLAEEIQTPGAGQVRALFTFAGNPVLSTPNGRRLDQALAGLEFMVSVDPYLNETTRHANFILPPVSPLERSHYDVALASLAVRNFARYSEPLFEKPTDAMHDHEILAELTVRLGPAPSGPASTPEQVLDHALRAGPYGTKNGGELNLGKLREAVHGVDLGPLKPCLARRLATADGRIHLAPEVYLHDLQRARSALDEPVPELLLIGRRHTRSNNSWLHNSYRLVKGKPRCTLMINPRDATARSLAAGDRVSLKSRVGQIEVSVEISDEVMPGVVSLPHGWGHDRAGVRLSVAGQFAGTSINDVIDEQAIDELTGTAVLNGTPVEIRRIGGDTAAASRSIDKIPA